LKRSVNYFNIATVNYANAVFEIENTSQCPGLVGVSRKINPKADIWIRKIKM